MKRYLFIFCVFSFLAIVISCNSKTHSKIKDGDYTAKVEFLGNDSEMHIFILHVDVENEQLMKMYWTKNDWIDAAHFTPPPIINNEAVLDIDNAKDFSTKRYLITILGNGNEYDSIRHSYYDKVKSLPELPTFSIWNKFKGKSVLCQSDGLYYLNDITVVANIFYYSNGLVHLTMTGIIFDNDEEIDFSNSSIRTSMMTYENALSYSETPDYVLNLFNNLSFDE